MPRCANCNEYETSKSSNFKRHVERCLRAHPRGVTPTNATTARASSQLRSRDDDKAQNGPVFEHLDPENEERRRLPPLTRYDAINQSAAYSSDEGEDEWSPRRSKNTLVGLSGSADHDNRQERVPRTMSTPVVTPREHRRPALPTPPASKLRRYNDAQPSIMTLAEQDRLITRVDELESMVVKLQHAVCVLDSRLQQFRMATSSWHPVMAEDS